MIVPHKKRSDARLCRPGFSLIELLVGSTVMLIVVLGAMYLYVQSNKITVDQQQFAELQHDVRSSMFFVSRDIRSAGVGLPEQWQGYFIEGTDNETQGGVVTPDRLVMMGNIEDPFTAVLANYNGSAANLTVEDQSFEQYHYPDEYYEDQFVLLLPNPDSGCSNYQVRMVTHVTHSATGTNERFNFSPGLAPGINPPGGLSGTCASSNDYDGGLVLLIEIKEFWLDITGNYTGLTAGENGYIGNGEGNIFYMTQNGYHFPIAQNVENLQFEYNGDFDSDGFLDGFREWDAAWTGDPLAVSRIAQVRILLLGRTPRPYVSVGGDPPDDIYHYRRPDVSNTTGDTVNDLHRRFMLESTVNIRNLVLSVYNNGERIK